MKKTAVVAVCALAAVNILTGCQKEKVEAMIQPLLSKEVEEQEAVAAKRETEEAQQTDLYFIDNSIPIQAGARVAVVTKSKNGQFWDLIHEGMQAAVDAVNEAYGFKKDEKITMTFEGPDSELEVEEQINMLDAVIAENPDVLCVCVSDMESCQAQLEAAKENGIPVVAFDSNVSETKLIRAFLASDNFYIGEMAAYRLGTTIGKMGKVAVFSAPERTHSARERTDGFLSNIANYTDIEVVEVVYQDQVEDMTAAMQEVLKKYPKLDGVFCNNADVAEMYLDIEKHFTEQRVVMVGVDATTRQQEAIRNGEEIGVISQQPYLMGYQTIWTALKATAPKKAGVKIKKQVLFKPAWMDLKALENPAYEDYLYKAS